ncbi:ATP-dependent DNA helicase [Alkalicaulis satelles]|uniref:ATP-dependent DNA helicase n=1 Tax=Alkalicaulis satelles TaxID=2609175 RepID=A0A5M6ZFI5_9PROT|nr:helicase-related protein [Alkalicaulis satelles]KAA5803506.1 ATP-dependent DNA helicase [Alkalicaulis satelles]
MTASHFRDAPVTAVLGPTNTGKTHLALERMMARQTGVMGLPLRLLARELYDKVVKAKGAASVALITGEEKIVPPHARFYLCTVEAMPLDLRPAFLAVDEIQLAADPERGHIFTERLLHARGTQETMFLGSASMRPILRRLVPEAVIETRERFSTLSYAGAKKLTKLPRRSAVVAFSAGDVYAMAELVRRQRGGAAVVMGALSPRTRNAQVELYQSGEVDFLIATDAIGMGLNMDVGHVAFASYAKFDGRRRRRLHPHEIGQIAGRAGRFRTDGTFGETAEARALDPEIIERVEAHDFDAIGRLVWRNHALDVSSLDALKLSLGAPAPDPALERVRAAVDEGVLDILSRDRDVRERASARGGAARLWDVCGTPQFRKGTLDEHARLVKTLFLHLTEGDGRLPDAWLDAQLTRLNRTAGDVDALAQRLTQVRTWSYAAHRPSWTRDPAYWQARSREVEDALSDALHERLAARFIDRRTSALMKGLRENADLQAGLDASGEVTVEGHFVGRLDALNFRADAAGGPLARRAVANAALKAVRPEVNRRLGQLARAGDDALALDDEGRVLWRDAPVARLVAGPHPFAPGVQLIGGELGAAEAVARAVAHIERFAARQASEGLAPLMALREQVEARSGGLEGLARGIAFRLVEGSGAAPRRDLAADIAALSAHERRQLRAAGVRIGEHAVFLPALLKPRAAGLNALLHGVHAGDAARAFRPPPGRTSAAPDPSLDDAAHACAGYQLCGPLAVRLDILERLADLIRESRQGDPARRFSPAPAMMNLLGCSQEDLRGVLRALGYRRVRKAEGETPELWTGRARDRRERTSAPPPPPADTPFAALAALDLTPQRPGRTAQGKPRRSTGRKGAARRARQ